MIQVHDIATTRLCYAALPGMIQRKHGGIINVASTAALLPTHATYSSTKVYLTFFSESLQMELKGTGVSVQALCPGLTIRVHDRQNFNRRKVSSSERQSSCGCRRTTWWLHRCGGLGAARSSVFRLDESPDAVLSEVP